MGGGAEVERPATEETSDLERGNRSLDPEPGAEAKLWPYWL